ncbi:MAG: guanylate kinase [Magnetococcales bacterium]|nr:guanylate kinase [Magnetococcales bacterium]MBF0420534.1 guanylate kinase [Magnetococcales bacterium]MBF0436712.1 guanylate kinase [Magnetococcales bacterium]
MKRGRGFVLIVTAPSGGGKGVLSRYLLESVADIRFSVSTTTRTIRPGEENGVHYFFVGKNIFEQMISDNAFVEWAEVFGNYYGTSRQALLTSLEAGQDVILDIDWQGARQIRSQMPDDVVQVAIVPPSRAELHRRLVARGQDAPEVIEKRMAMAGQELSHWHEADYVVINDHLEIACGDMVAIVRAERLKRGRMARRVENIVAHFGVRDEKALP